MGENIAALAFVAAIAVLAVGSTAMVFGKAKQREDEHTRRRVVNEGATPREEPGRPIKCTGGPFAGSYTVLPYTQTTLYIYEWPSGVLHRSPDPKWPPVRFIEPETFALRGHSANPHEYEPGPKYLGLYQLQDARDSATTGGARRELIWYGREATP